MAVQPSPSISSTKGASVMAKGVAFDMYDPAKIDALRQAQKPAEKGDHKTAPGPARRECAECGSPLAHFGVGVSLLQGVDGDWFCRKHAPRDYRAEVAP